MWESSDQRPNVLSLGREEPGSHGSFLPQAFFWQKLPFCKQWVPHPVILLEAQEPAASGHLQHRIPSQGILHKPATRPGG